MSFSNALRRHRRDALVTLVSAGLVAISSSEAVALDHPHHDNGDDDGPLHFAHPLFTESPSPDTKVRLDYLFRRLTSQGYEHSVRLEAEYAFTPAVSLEANVPLTSRSESGTTANSVGSGEIALKLASYAAAERGLLLGGGVAFGVPTGSDRKAIGSSHLVEVEPYIDAGYKHGETELVTFVSFSTAMHRRANEGREEAVALAISGLQHVAERVEVLAEFQSERSVAGGESGRQTASGALGIKYHLGRVHHLVVGIGGRLPITRERDSEHEVLLSALWHF